MSLSSWRWPSRSAPTWRASTRAGRWVWIASSVGSSAASAAAGMAVVVALIGGFARRSAETIGNFWVDLTRTTLYILLPLSFVFALVLVSQGVVQTFGPYAKATVVRPTSYDEPITDKDGKPVLDEKGQPKTKKSTLTEQVIAVGPAASQIAIRQLRSEEHTSELQSQSNLVCRLLL